LYHPNHQLPDKDKTIAKIVWRVQYPHWTESAPVQSKKQLPRTVLPVGVAYQTTDKHDFSWYSAFLKQGIPISSESSGMKWQWHRLLLLLLTMILIK